MINDMFTPDPENLNQEEEQELTDLLQDAMHEYEAGPNGKCILPTRQYCYEHEKIDYHNSCGLPPYSVLHYETEAENRANHCGDYDCMHFEGDYY